MYICMHVCTYVHMCVCGVCENVIYFSMYVCDVCDACLGCSACMYEYMYECMLGYVHYCV